MTDIILYSTGCPKCKVLETKLEAKHIQYEKRSDVQEMIDMGISSAPVLSVDGELKKFADAVAYVNGLEGK